MEKKYTFKFIIAIILVIIFVMTLKYSYSKEDVSIGAKIYSNELTIAFASDLHYLSPEMTDYGEHFMDIISSADGKVTHYTPELTKAFVQQVLDSSIDVFVISGDLTLNGDEQSHDDLAKLLKPLTEEGIRVFIIPGNHDVDSDAYQFIDDKVKRISGTRGDKFTKIYQGMSYDQGFEKDKNSLSYVVKLNKDNWLLMIDVNANGAKGFISNDSLAWVEEQLKQAKQSKATIIGVSHQNLLVHNKNFKYGYQIFGAEKLIRLYREYGVKLHFSGHMHLQHIKDESGITEILSSSIAVSPNQNGVLKINPHKFTYQTVPVDVASWAKANKITDANLLDFTNYSKNFFDKTSKNKILKGLNNNKNISKKDKKIMKDFALKANRAYFAGNISAISKESKGYQLWKEKLPDARFTNYLESITEQPFLDMNSWQSY